MDVIEEVSSGFSEIGVLHFSVNETDAMMRNFESRRLQFIHIARFRPVHRRVRGLFLPYQDAYGRRGPERILKDRLRERPHGADPSHLLHQLLHHRHLPLPLPGVHVQRGEHSAEGFLRAPPLRHHPEGKQAPQRDRAGIRGRGEAPLPHPVRRDPEELNRPAKRSII